MASAEEAATIRLVFCDSEENVNIPVADFHTNQTSSAAKAYPADRDALALPLMPATTAWVDGDRRSKIKLEAKSDAADTVESEECDGVFPIVLKHKATGVTVVKQLRLGDSGTADFSGFNATHDVALVTTDFRKLGAYTVPSGYMATLAAGRPVHCYLGDDTA